MTEALDSNNHNAIVTIADCEKGFKSNYICITKNCDAEISFTYKFERRYSEKTIEVPSFFGLKNGEVHKLGECPFNTLGVISIIAKDSDSNTLKAISESKYEFSLQILHLFSNYNDKSENKTIESNSNKPNQPKQKQYIKKGLLNSYIKTLQQIIQLRIMVEKNKDVSQYLTFKYRDKKINWNSFYFEVEEYSKIFDKIIKMDKKHPICISGRVKSITAPTEKFNFYTVKLLSPWIASNDSIKKVPTVSLNFPANNYNANIKEGSELISYGEVYGKEADKLWLPTNGEQGIMFQNIKMRINHKEQVLLLN